VARRGRRVWVSGSCVLLWTDSLSLLQQVTQWDCTGPSVCMYLTALDEYIILCTVLYLYCTVYCCGLSPHFSNLPPCCASSLPLPCSLSLPCLVGVPACGVPASYLRCADGVPPRCCLQEEVVWEREEAWGRWWGQCSRSCPERPAGRVAAMERGIHDWLHVSAPLPPFPPLLSSAPPPLFATDARDSGGWLAAVASALHCFSAPSSALDIPPPPCLLCCSGGPPCCLSFLASPWTHRLRLTPRGSGLNSGLYS